MRRLAFWMLVPFALPQGLRLRRSAPRFAAARGTPHGCEGRGAPLRLLAIGDSIIAGVGAETVDEALPRRTAQALAKRLDRAVHWTARGRIGATAETVQTRLIPRLPAEAFDVIILSVGVNDVTGLHRTARWRANLGALLDALRTHSPEALVVMIGVPPLHGFPLLPPSLRFLLGMRARTFDAVAEREVTRRRGCRYVPARFDPRPEQFAPDGYHPSAESYREWAERLADLITECLSV